MTRREGILLLLGVVISKTVVDISVMFFILSDSIDHIQKSGIGSEFPVVDRNFRSLLSGPFIDFTALF